MFDEAISDILAVAAMSVTAVAMMWLPSLLVA